MIRAAAIVIALFVGSARAAAQARPEIFAGYAFVHDAKNAVSLPAGWMAGGAWPLADWLSAVGDVSGGYSTEHQFGAELQLRAYGIFGGARASSRLGRVTEFAELLAGVVRGSGAAFGFTETTSAFALQPGVGVDYPLSARLAARGELDVRFIRNGPDGNEAGYEYRVAAAIVYRIK
jgi:hypothetical protein